MSNEELQLPISSQLTAMAMKYWFLWSNNTVWVNETLEALKTPANCKGITVPVLAKEVAKNRKVILLHEMSNKRLSNIKKLVSTTQS